MTTLNHFTVRRIDGSELALSTLTGQVVLIVNTASACGFTPQFAGLQTLHDTYGAPGLLGSKAIKWNFTKFLVGRDGRVIRRYAPQDTPAKLAQDIEAALQA